MNCQQVNKYIERYDEGSLPPQIAFQLENHLQNCDKCQTLLCLATRERVCLEGDTDIPSLSPGFVQGVMARIQVTSTQNLPPLVPVWVEWTRRYPTLLGAAAVVLLFVFPLLGKPAANYEKIPPAIQYTQKMAAIDQARNVPFTNSTLPSRIELEASIYRDQPRSVSDEGPSRSVSAKKLDTSEESVQETATTAAPVPQGLLAAKQMQDKTIPPVLPGYIPSGYILDKTVINEDNSVTVQYLLADNKSAEPLVLNITPEKAALKSFGLTGGEKAEPALGEPITELKVEQDNTVNKNKVTNISAVYQENGYILTTNLPLAAEEMDGLSHSLQRAQP